MSVFQHQQAIRLDRFGRNACAETIRVVSRHGDEKSVLKQDAAVHIRSEEHTSELQSLMRISYAVFCLKKKKKNKQTKHLRTTTRDTLRTSITRDENIYTDK